MIDGSLSCACTEAIGFVSGVREEEAGLVLTAECVELRLPDADVLDP
jgi:hypothetical protein